MTRDRTDTAVTLLDDATRPKAPKIAGVTAEQRRRGKGLALIHDHHLAQIDRVRFVMEQVEAGAEGLAALRDAISSMDMTANYRLFGNLCGHECRMLTLHHTIEDHSIFPALRQGSDGLRKVVERLAEEHLIIHRLLEKLEAGAVQAIKQPGRETFTQLKAAFVALEGVVRSHFGYEQGELEEALGYFDILL